MGGPCFCDGETLHELDNFRRSPFVIAGKRWLSAEQYFQAMKFPSSPDYQEQIRAVADGQRCWSMGNTRAHRLRADWEAVKVEIMYRANLAKFSQHQQLRRVLCGTRGRITAGGFPFWARWNAILLERIREELRSPASVGGGLERESFAQPCCFSLCLPRIPTLRRTVVPDLGTATDTHVGQRITAHPFWCDD